MAALESAIAWLASNKQLFVASIGGCWRMRALDLSSSAKACPVFLRPVKQQGGTGVQLSLFSRAPKI